MTAVAQTRDVADFWRPNIVQRLMFERLFNKAVP